MHKQQNVVCIMVTSNGDCSKDRRFDSPKVTKLPGLGLGLAVRLSDFGLSTFGLSTHNPSNCTLSVLPDCVWCWSVTARVLSLCVALVSVLFQTVSPSVACLSRSYSVCGLCLPGLCLPDLSPTLTLCVWSWSVSCPSLSLCVWSVSLWVYLCVWSEWVACLVSLTDAWFVALVRLTCQPEQLRSLFLQIIIQFLSANHTQTYHHHSSPTDQSISQQPCQYSLLIQTFVVCQSINDWHLRPHFQNFLGKSREDFSSSINFWQYLRKHLPDIISLYLLIHDLTTTSCNGIEQDIKIRANYNHYCIIIMSQFKISSLLNIFIWFS